MEWNNSNSMLLSLLSAIGVEDRRTMEWYHSNSMLLSLISAMVVCIITAFVVMRKLSKLKKLPPGPRGLPIIGHLHMLGKLPHQSLCELSKIHGPLMSLRLGSVPVVVASSPEMARQILQTHDRHFANRMSTGVVDIIFQGCRDIAFSPPGPHWKLVRRLVAAEVVSNKGLSFFKPVRIEEVRRLMQWVLAESGDAKPQQMRPKLQGVTNDIIMRMMVGKRFAELEGIEGSPSIMELITELVDLLAMFNVGDYLPRIAWMDLQGCGRRSKKLGADLRAAFESTIHGRRLEDGRPPNDYLDILLEASASASSDTPIHIMEVILELLAAATDATSFTLEWTLAELILNPGKMRIVQAEIDEAVGGRARIVEEADIDHLPFLVACVKESMRLHPTAPLLIPHKTNEACEILGFQILPNTQAFVNVWAIGRDPTVWENPTKFYPERFLEPNCADVQGQHFELVPFGSGRRICPGWRLAMRSVHIILASLLQGFEWSIPPSHHLDMSESLYFSLTLTTPLVACATPRLPKELY